MQNISKRYLFWCYMNNEGEAWFEVARDKKIARKNFSANLGCDISEIRSKLVCEISDQKRINSRYGIQTDFLKAIGFEIVSENMPRIVRYQGKIYREDLFLRRYLKMELYLNFRVYTFSVFWKQIDIKSGLQEI